MDPQKPLYITSYIKAIAQEESGSKSVDKSVFEAVQNAILSVLGRGFHVEKGRAVLNTPVPGSAETETEEPEQTKAPSPSSRTSSVRINDPGQFDDVVLIQIANQSVYQTCSTSRNVIVLDLDRLGRMIGNPFYDSEIRELVAALRAADSKIKEFDCAGTAQLIETQHRKRLP